MPQDRQAFSQPFILGRTGKERPIPSHEDYSQPSGYTQPHVDESLLQAETLRRLTSIENKVDTLISVFTINPVPINTLGNEYWELKTPIFVAIEIREDNDFVACLYDVDLYGYGDSVPEALEDLKEAIVNQFEYLTENESEFQIEGPLRKQLDFLNNILVKTNA